MESVYLGNLLTVMIFLTLPAILPLVIRPRGANRFGAPVTSLSFAQAVSANFNRMTDFTGRAGRAEFWWNALLWGTVYILATIAARQSGQQLYTLLAVVFLMPLLAVGARRLHDINRTGWWQLIGIIGFGVVGLIILFAWPTQKDAG